MYDVIVIGAGIIGAAVSRELSKFKLNILLIDKASDIATGATKANSGIIHAGYDAKIGTNKAKFNVLGNFMYENICKELEVPFKRIGSLVIGFNEKDKIILKELYENGKKLAIPGLEIINSDRIKELEPNLNENIVSGLYAPTAGIVEPWELAIAYVENAMDNGLDLKLETKVLNINQIKSYYEIKTNRGIYNSKFVINCAGIYADKVYEMLTQDSKFKIVPRRGQYYLLDHSEKDLVNHVIFQCPSELGKGVLIAPTIDENIIIGPDAENLNEDSRELTNTTIDGLEFIKETAYKTCKKISFNKSITNFAGLRAEATNGDFIIEESKEFKHFINCAGIKSPGLSSAPAIADYIANMIKNLNPSIEMKSKFNSKRKARIKFNKLSSVEKSELIKGDPNYGRIICRCEMITEGEILDAIHRNAGGKTINGIKRRVRPGAGRCQGGFCGPKVMKILARELDISILEIKQENEGSKILVKETKEIK